MYNEFKLNESLWSLGLHKHVQCFKGKVRTVAKTHLKMNKDLMPVSP